MAPVRPKKRKSTESASDVDVASFPLPPTTSTKSPVRTPTRSPIKKRRVGLTMRQKQALMDNLQLEITERARKLRAQYMLQAHGLRTRLEMRINRIPTALRKVTMEELLQRHAEGGFKPTAPRGVPRPALTAARSTRAFQREQESPSPRKPKRTSGEISSGDKENENLLQPAKRVRAEQTAPTGPNISRAKLQPGQVLSPKSSNSRYIPGRPASRVAAVATSVRAAAAVSPVKTSASAVTILTNMVDKAKSTRAAAAAAKKATAASRTKASTASTSSTSTTGRARRGAAAGATTQHGRNSDVSEASESSTGTTIIRRGAAAPSAAPKRAPAVKKTVMNGIKNIGASVKAPRKTTTRAQGATATAAATRSLRKRN